MTRLDEAVAKLRDCAGWNDCPCKAELEAVLKALGITTLAPVHHGPPGPHSSKSISDQGRAVERRQDWPRVT